MEGNADGEVVCIEALEDMFVAQEVYQTAPRVPRVAQEHLLVVAKVSREHNRA